MSFGTKYRRLAVVMAAALVCAALLAACRSTPQQWPSATSTTETASPTASAQPTATAGATSTGSPQPTATSSTGITVTVTPAQPPTPTQAAIPSATVAPTASPTPVTPTATPSASPTATATPTPTTTPGGGSGSPTVVPTVTATVDPRYGLIMTSDRQRARNLLGVTEFIDYTMNASDVPAGMRKVLYIRSVSPVPVGQIQAAAAAAPGSVWYVLGEPNAHGNAVADVIVGLHDTYVAIKAADPTALITSPSILNFGFTCTNCGGYTPGGVWIDSFRKTYIDIYGTEPPIDIWAIDVFPIVWPSQLPNGTPTVSQAFPTVRGDIVRRQIEDYRGWLNAYDASRGKPIWVTEFGLHWGFSDWNTNAPGCNTPAPAGTYETEKVKDYLREVYTWLEANSSPMNIQRWFTFTSYRDLSICHADSANGLSLLDGPGPNGNLTEIGQFYRDWVRGVR